MAKNRENAEATEATEATAAAAPVEENRVDERYKMVTLADGTQVKRLDYIRKLWKEGKMSRGEIAKHLTDLTGKKVPYQIVFAATKGHAGGPPKTEAAAPETPASE